jgi:hypothetical protein
MDNEAFDYSKTDIADGAKMSRATLFKVWPRLEVLDLITATRSVGQARMYRLNKKNPIVTKLMELDDAISEYFAMKRCRSEVGSQDAGISEIIRQDQDEAKVIA